MIRNLFPTGRAYFLKKAPFPGKRFFLGKFLVYVAFSLCAYGVGGADDVEGGFTTPDGQYRFYLFHIPPQYTGNNPFPLVINMHGAFGSAYSHPNVTEMNVTADEQGFLTLYPNSIMGSSWNSGPGYGSDADDVGFISALIDTLVANYSIDTLRIYATGHSAGAMMAYRLACELAVKIAAVAPVAGGLALASCQPSRPIPIMHFQGRDDPLVSYPSIEELIVEWAERNGCDLGPDTFYNDSGALRQTWSRTDGISEVVFWTANHGGHAWPGASWGTQELSANELMWEFFVAHPLPVEEEPGVEESRTPPSYEFAPNNPGIFNRSTTISFSLGSREHVTIKVFDVLGREIATIVDGVLDAGKHSVVLDATDMQNGVYFYRLETSAFSSTQSIRLIK